MNKILLVHDEYAIALRAAHTLEESGYEVAIARCGEEALEISRQDPSITMIIMDMDPGEGVDGPGTARRILSERSLPVVFFTSCSERSLADRVSGIPHYGCVQKDSGSFVLQSAVETAFNLFEARNRALASEEKYRVIADYTYDWETWLGPGGEMLYMSPSCERITGYSPGEFLADPGLLQRIIHPGDRETCDGHFQEMGSPGPPDSLEFRIIGRDGRERWIHHVGQDILDGEGRWIGRRGSNRDITESRMIRRDLEAANEKLDTLWGIAQLVDTDLETICEHILTQSAALTSSPYGFYGFINDDESVMTIYTWSGNAMKDCSMVSHPQQFPICDAGVWGEAVRCREPFILNDFTAEHPAKKGYPAGHVALTRLMVVPAFSKGRIVSVTAVANKEEDYTTADVTLLSSFMISVQAIIDHKFAEREVQRLLAEKELLLREVHHRIKNNVNTAMSLISLQAALIADPQAVTALNETRGRLQSMMLLYDLLYRSADFRILPSHEYIGLIIQHLQSAFRGGAPIDIRLQVDEMYIDSKILFSLGIIVNELVTNAFKYAFHGGEKGIVSVSLSRDRGLVRLLVGDNGIGLPEGTGPGAPGGFGLQLVSILVKQIRGHLEIRRTGGTEFVVDFPLP